MKNAYPIILRTIPKGFSAHIPDFGLTIECESIFSVIEKARNEIGIRGAKMASENKTIPDPSKVITTKENEYVTLVDVDFLPYAKKIKQTTVKKNCTLPGWLSYEAEKANINFSAVLQSALKKELGIED